jgi:hypothetical protein
LPAIRRRESRRRTHHAPALYASDRDGLRTA